MILTKIIKMSWNSNNKNYYINKGYNFTKMYDTFEVKIEDINHNSKYTIEVKCDKCETIKKLTVKRYFVNINNCNYYACCNKCANDKNIQTNLIKYNVEYPQQNKDINNKSKKTCLKNYNVENPSQSILIKNKKKETCLKNYNVEYSIQNKEIREKSKQTIFNNYGVEYPTQNKEIKNKIRQTNIKNNRWTSVDNETDFKIYYRIVNNLTLKNKKELFKIWDGYDYYDNEYIKENINIDSNNKKYPTIDHKISIHYGFVNNILPYIIADINNLCITKRSINSSKSNKSHFKCISYSH